jgi:hypothetical protein
MAQANVAQSLVCALGNADRKSPPRASAEGSLTKPVGRVVIEAPCGN